MEIKQVLIIRKDVTLSNVELISLITKASAQASELTRVTQAEIFAKWWQQGQKKITVKAYTKNEFDELIMYCEQSKIPYATESHNDELAILAIGPTNSAKIDLKTQHLKLV